MLKPTPINVRDNSRKGSKRGRNFTPCAHISISFFHLLFSRIECCIACTISYPFSTNFAYFLVYVFYAMLCSTICLNHTFYLTRRSKFFLTSWSRIYSHLVEFEGSVPYSESRILILSQVNPENSFPFCLKPFLILFSHLRLPNGNLLSELRTKLPYKFLVSPVHIAWLTNFILLDLNTPIIFGGYKESWSS